MHLFNKSLIFRASSYRGYKNLRAESILKFEIFFLFYRVANNLGSRQMKGVLLFFRFL